MIPKITTEAFSSLLLYCTNKQENTKLIILTPHSPPPLYPYMGKESDRQHTRSDQKLFRKPFMHLPDKLKRSVLWVLRGEKTFDGSFLGGVSFSTARIKSAFVFTGYSVFPKLFPKRKAYSVGDLLCYLKAMAVCGQITRSRCFLKFNRFLIT